MTLESCDDFARPVVAHRHHVTLVPLQFPLLSARQSLPRPLAQVRNKIARLCQLKEVKEQGEGGTKEVEG